MELFHSVDPFVSEDDYDEKCVSVLLEGEEAELVFIDHPSAEISVSVKTTSDLILLSLVLHPLDSLKRSKFQN